MWLFIGQAIWYILPAGLANIAASLSRFTGFSATPVDFGRTWRGKPLFGANKTWRGLVAGAIIGQAVYTVQIYLYHLGFFHKLSMLDYTKHLFFLGALLDLLKKR